DHHEAALATRDGSLDEEDAGLGVDLVDLEVHGGHTLVTHASRHGLALEHAARGGCAADGTRLAVHRLRTVRGALTAEAVALHGAGETLALGGPCDVDEGAVGEHVRAELLAQLEAGRLLGAVEPELHEVAAWGHARLGELARDGRAWGHARLGELARDGLGDLTGVDRAEGDLHGVVAVGLFTSDPGDDARPGLDDGHRDDPVVLVEDLGHAELGAQD